MARRRVRLLGLDIGHYSIKAVEIEGYDSSNWGISAAGSIRTPSDCVADGVVAQPFVLSEAIRSLVKENRIQSHSAYCAVSGPAIHFRPIRLPRMNDANLRKAVMFKAGETARNISVDEMIVEYDVQKTDSRSVDLDVLMVAAPRAIVESRTETVNKAGLTVEAMDLEGFSLMRALVDYSPDEADRRQTLGIVSMGYTNTEFNIVTRGVFSFPRSVPIGGAHLAQAIRAVRGSEGSDLETMEGLIDLRRLLVGDPDATGTGLEQIIRPTLDEMVRELTRSINYYQSQFTEGAAEANLDHLVLCGGVSRIIGMKEYLTDRLHMDVRIADPACRYNNSHSTDGPVATSPAMVGALGLALYDLPN